MLLENGQEIPVQLAFRGVGSADSAYRFVKRELSRLVELDPRILSAKVAIEVPHQHRHRGRLFRVRIQVHTPGRVLVVGQDPTFAHRYEDPYVALHDAFHAMRRQVEDFVRVRARRVKSHDFPGRAALREWARDQREVQAVRRRTRAS